MSTSTTKRGVTTEWSGDKKSSGTKKDSRKAEQKLYIVTRETIDCHNYNGGFDGVEIRGTFLSLRKANEAAREDLLNEWDEDSFEEYEVDERNGMVIVTATCPEGEIMTVRVAETRKRVHLKPKHSDKLASQKVYHVKRETTNEYNDCGMEIRGTYSSLCEANKAARKDLLSEWGDDYFEEYRVKEEDGMVTVEATCPEGEVMTVTVEEMHLCDEDKEDVDEEDEDEEGEDEGDEGDEEEEDGEEGSE
jgi:hypothetical protein